MLDKIKNELNETMGKSIVTFKNQLLKIRTGRASANILDGIMVNYYGTPSPIKQLGQISTPEARLLQIQPYDKSILAEIEKSILGANLGLTPGNDGNLIRIPFPALTEEKRKDLVKNLKKLGEEAKVAVRTLRREQNEKVKKAEKNKEVSEDDSKKYQDEIQEITDNFVKQIDQLVAGKEKELLTI